MRVQTLDQEDPLEEEMATHSSILAWKISWPEKPGGLQSIRSQRVGRNLSDLTQHSIHTSDYNRLNFEKTYTTDPIVIELATVSQSYICPFALPFVTCDGYKSRFTQCTTKRMRFEVWKRKPRETVMTPSGLDCSHVLAGSVEQKFCLLELQLSCISLLV